MDNICGGACKAISDFNRSLGSCYFVRIVNERTSVASFARACRSTRLIIRFKYTSNWKVPHVLSRLNEIKWGCEKILPVSLSFWSNEKFFKMMFLAAMLYYVDGKLV